LSRVTTPGADPGDANGAIALPKTYNFFHHDFLQLGKQDSRYKAIFPSIVLLQQCCEVLFFFVQKVTSDVDY